MFGLSCAPEMFQKTMEQILAGCENVINYIDDIFIFGETEEEHNTALAKVLSVLKENNIMLNQDKCIFKAQQLDFLGHVISANGVRPTEQKIQALQKFREPRTSDEVRSFLGLVTYVGKFIPDMATITAPLRELICGANPFKWTDEHQRSFEKLKQLISNANTLAFFNNSLRTRVVADASPVALGAVLLQFADNTDNCPRLISYASKSLTTAEKRYCQTEKEALALVWAVEKFSEYLIGREFELETDHKPLEVIFSPSSTPCARIERWVLRLQSFRFTVKYRKGSGNIADSLSRLVCSDNANDLEKDSHFMVLAIQESVAVDICEIEEASPDDPEIAAVKECLRGGQWKNPLTKPYEPFQNELGFIGDTMIRGNKLVVPKKLRERMLQLAHEDHPGESVMKRRLRDRAWWPSMDRETKEHCTSCEGCQLVSFPSRPEPMNRRELPTKPWIDVAIDFMGPLPSGEYLLVVIDYFSRYKEVEIMNRITASETVERLGKIFTRLGYPRTITLDNAKQFIGKEFENYCKIHGITLNHTAPYWPQENGLVERQNRSLLKRLQISHGLGRDWKRDLKDYLIMYYTTPHSTTGKTPTELCYGRTIRSKLPAIQDIESIPPASDFRDQDFLSKQKGKEREDIRRHAKHSDIDEGDTVLMKNLMPKNKLSTVFNKTKYTVVDRSGPRATVEDTDTGAMYERNVAHLKKINDDTRVATEQRCDETMVDDRSINEEDNFAGFPIEDEEVPNHGFIDDGERQRRGRKVPEKYKDFVM